MLFPIIKFASAESSTPVIAKLPFTLLNSIISLFLQIKFKKLNAIIKNTFSKDQNIESNYNGKTSINFSGTKLIFL